MKFISNCNQIRCAFRENCQRYNPEGNDTPILMFLPDGVVGDHLGELDGCTDFWPKKEFSTTEKKIKTNV
jgi:hypothetical protein